MTQEKSPFLQGAFAPYRHEDDIADLKVIGKIPKDLNGTLLRNGPNPQFDPVGFYHWFTGDGMLHAIQFENGKANYHNRWVRTERFEFEKKVGKPVFCSSLREDAGDLTEGVSHNTANTNVIPYQNTVLALNEGSAPIEIQLDSLDTIGDYDFNGQVKGTLTAHPRIDHRRSEFIAYSYINDDGSLQYYRLNAENQLLASAAINWPYPAMIHDFINTENYVIFPIFPCTMSFERMQKSQSIFMWEGDEYNTHFIVTDRDGKEVMRVETDPCFVYHFGNAYEQGNTIIIDAMRSEKTSLFPDRFGNMATRHNNKTELVRWTIDVEKHSISLKQFDDTQGEFPRFDERFNGYPYQYLYLGASKDDGDLFDRILAYDVKLGKKTVRHFGDDVPGEPVFVPRSENEGDGYLLTVVYRTVEDRSDVVILDAQDISKDPLAIVQIPHRIPLGFHGNFLVF